MNVGIVGAEKAKFTIEGRAAAMEIIERLLKKRRDVPVLVSGRCPLGGVDIWAEHIAKRRHLEMAIFPPKARNWSHGYKPRNLLIARNSDIVHVIVVDRYPSDFEGRRFPECYHCRPTGRDCRHVKSGACWTANRAIEAGTETRWHVVQNFA